jgi:hypothetical protein
MICNDIKNQFVSVLGGWGISPIMSDLDSWTNFFNINHYIIKESGNGLGVV